MPILFCSLSWFGCFLTITTKNHGKAKMASSTDKRRNFLKKFYSESKDASNTLYIKNIEKIVQCKAFSQGKSIMHHFLALFW